MDTRSKTAQSQLSEAELAIVERRLDEKRAQLDNQAAALNNRAKELDEREKLAFNKNISEDDAKTREIEELRRAIEAINRTQATAPPVPNPYAYTSTQSMPPPNCTPMTNASFREILDAVPPFSGTNIPLGSFVRACRRARDAVPGFWEHDLTRSLINKLRGRAYEAIDGEICNNVTQLIDLLETSFGSPKSIDEYRGELSAVYLRRGEHVLDYVSRVKELRTAIIDAERRLHGSLPGDVILEIDQLTTRAFCGGLPPDYRLNMRGTVYSSPNDAFAAAKLLARRAEIDRDRHGTPTHGIDPPQRARAFREPEPREPYRDRYLNNRDDRHPRQREDGFPQRRDNNYQRRDNDYQRRSPADRQSAPPGWSNTRAPPPRDSYQNAQRSNAPPVARKWCRYCKKDGHEIEECRKREYNNSRSQGNFPGPSRRPDPPRSPGLQQPRPINAISASPEPRESGSSAPIASPTHPQ